VRLALALALTLAADPAVACHRYSVWHYPFRQSCGAARLSKASVFRVQLSKALGNQIRKPVSFVNRAPEMPTVPLPSLAKADLDEPEADEPTRARVLLRAALEGDNR
jgi:hypothetical protein